MQKRHMKEPVGVQRWRLARGALVGLILVGLFMVGAGLVFADWWSALPETAQATYVGRESCIKCHQQQADQWHGSHHDLAMDRATEESVLGDFSGAELEHFGIVSRMYRDGEKFMIHTEGPDGKMADFEIKYVFGVDPLQQYMVEFDRTPDMNEDEVGRLQVLRVSWDTHQKKWFYLPPPDVTDKLEPDDDLHWTGIAQRWNTMCADCHSTNLQKNYDVETGQYRTTFTDIDVSCETCHGPGSLHVQLANAPSLFWDRKRGYALPHLKSSDSNIEVHTCAQCHSRRRIVHPDYRPGENYYDHFSNELLHGLAYHADGQILDEVYVYGSFLQSKMYHKGVRCTDCHDPHSVRLKYEGNQLCTSCHQHAAGKYDTPAHHHHPVGSTGARCVACHMPETTYMEVDPRRDHSLRVPRPDLSVELGTPNACTGCHLKETQLSDDVVGSFKQYADWIHAAQNGNEPVKQELARLDAWAKQYVEQWYGPQDDVEHFAATLAAGRQGDPAAEAGLIGLASNQRLSAIVRATALMELGQFSSRESLETSVRELKDPDPQVRAAAVANLGALPDEQLVEHAVPLLQDPIRLVRTEAARVLARAPSHLLDGQQRRQLRAAIEELKAGLMVTSDRAQSHMTLGILYEDLGDPAAAIQAYETAMRVEPRTAGPRTNLAPLLDRLTAHAARQNDPASRQEAEQYRARAAQLRKEELALLERDVQLAPENAMIQYRYGLLLYLHGRLEEAEQALEEAHRLEPDAADFMLGLALFYQKQGRNQEALELTRRLLELQPNNPSYLQLLRSLGG